jgi:hypothetical protein
MLQIEEVDVERVTITCKSRFHIQVPRYLTGDARQEAIEQAFVDWKRDRARLDISIFAKVYARKLGVKPREVKLSEQKRVWGTCDKDGTIRIKLAANPRPFSGSGICRCSRSRPFITPPSWGCLLGMLGSVMPRLERAQS